MEPLDADFVCKLLLKAEQGIHRGGWDQRPFLATLVMTRPNTIGLAEIPVPVENPPGDFVAFLGKRSLHDPELGRTVAELVGPPFLGFALVTEAWMIAQLPEDAMARYASGVRLADTPGAEEARNINAVDIWGRVFMVHRVRGKKPEAFGGKPEDNPSGLTDVAGRLVQGLLDLTLGAARQMPWLAGCLTDLETRFVPTVEESFEAVRRARANPME